MVSPELQTPPVGSLIQWSGVDVLTSNSGDISTITDFIARNGTEVRDDNSQFQHRYVLLAPTRGRSVSSPFLTELSLSDEHGEQSPEGAARDFANCVPPASRDGIRIGWSVTCRLLGDTGPQLVRPYAIYVVGVNPPANIDAAGLVEFNNFYSTVHLPEVAARRHCLRASRYELAQTILRPDGGCPRFLAVYELDEKAAATRRHIGGTYSPGPPIWRRHTTPWRLWYRRITERVELG